MMATTHAYVGVALVLASLPVTGKYAPTTSLLIAAFVGGLFPDLDLLTSHRKTLHFPVLYPSAACVLFVVSLAIGSQLLFLLAITVWSAAVHSLSDIFGGGVGYEPWNGQSTRAVYNHVSGHWHRPRRVVRYSGAPEDFGLCVALALPVVLAQATGPSLDILLVAVLFGSALYAATRRRLSVIADCIRSVLPTVVVERLPTIRFEEG